MIEVQRAFLEQIASTIQPSRTIDRLERGINLDQRKALLLDNVFAPIATSTSPVEYSPTTEFAVEIKPKWGFTDPQTGRCRFCTHNALKDKQSSSTYQRSHYCPRFLYSQDEGKMRHSIQSLLKTPNNNIRVYRNGQHQDHLDDKSIHRLVYILHSSRILVKLAADQERFHDDVFKLEELLVKECASAQSLGSGRRQEDIEEILCKVDQMLLLQPQSVLLQTLSTLPAKSLGNAPPLSSTSSSGDGRQELIERIARFTVSLTLKDLSLVVVVGKEDLEKETNSIFMLDCDSKPAKKLLSTLALERELATIPSFCIFHDPSFHTAHLPSS